MTVFVLNMTGFVLNVTGLVLNMTGFVLNITRFVLNITGFVLQMTVFVLNMTGFVLNITEFEDPKIYGYNGIALYQVQPGSCRHYTAECLICHIHSMMIFFFRPAGLNIDSGVLMK